MPTTDSTELEARARAALARGDLTAAEATFTTLAAQPAAHAAGLYGLALVADRDGRRAEALNLMSRAIDADPQHANALFYLGLWTKADNAQAAANLFRRCLREAPNHAGALGQLGQSAPTASPPTTQSPVPNTPRHPASARAGMPSPTTPAPSSTQEATRLTPPRPPSNWAHLVGYIVEMSERVEGRNSAAFGVRAFEIVVQGVDEAGQKGMIESVEMRGAGHIGMMAKGHWVEVDRARMRGRQGSTITQLHNLTTGRDVVVRGVWSSASGRRGVFVIAPLVFLALMGGGMWWAIRQGSSATTGIFITVPDVRSQHNAADAVAALHSAGFSEVETRTDLGPDAATLTRGSIESTEPPAGAKWANYMSIIVVIAGGAGVIGSPTSIPKPTATGAPTSGTPSQPNGGGTTAGATANCSDEQVQTSEGHRSGTRAVVLLFTNVSGRSCTLAGYPGVQLIDTVTGQRVDVPRSPRGPSGGLANGLTTYPRPVLTPGSMASAVLEALSTPPSNGTGGPGAAGGATTTPTMPGPPVTTTPPVPSSTPPPWVSPFAEGWTPGSHLAYDRVGVVSGEQTACAYAAISVIAPNTSRVTLLTPGITGCSPTIHPVLPGLDGR